MSLNLNQIYLINQDKIQFIKNRPDAIIPTKAYKMDSGFDLTILEKVKDFNEHTSLYTTGIKVKPPVGYYTEVVPRSSISKTNYRLANSIGIIDEEYRGEILIALTKIDIKADTINLPIKIAQLIVRKRHDFDSEEVEFFTETERGDGAFGSTGK